MGVFLAFMLLLLSVKGCSWFETGEATREIRTISAGESGAHAVHRITKALKAPSFRVSGKSLATTREPIRLATGRAQRKARNRDRPTVRQQFPRNSETRRLGCLCSR